MGSWRTILAKQCTYCEHRPNHDESQLLPDIELGAFCKKSKTADSGIPPESLSLVTHGHTTPKSSFDSQLRRPICLKFDFGDRIHVKPLDYGTFSRWSAMESFVLDMENEGIIIEEFWDVAENMRVWSGDWDARVRPGWDVYVQCQDVQAVLRKQRFEDDSNSEDYESDGERWTEDILNQYQEDCCLPRWKDRAQKEKLISGRMQEPSWMALSLGCASMVVFVVTVVIYTV